MAQITNAELKRQLDELSSFVKTQNELNTLRVEKVEKRMDVLEEQWKHVTPVIKRVDDFFTFLRKFLTVIKWLAGIAAAAVAGQATIWAIQHLFH